MLCKTGNSILPQGLLENIAQSTTSQQSIKTKAFTVPTIGNMPDIHVQTFIVSPAFSLM